MREQLRAQRLEREKSWRLFIHYFYAREMDKFSINVTAFDQTFSINFKNIDSKSDQTITLQKIHQHELRRKSMADAQTALSKLISNK